MRVPLFETPLQPVLLQYNGWKKFNNMRKSSVSERTCGKRKRKATGEIDIGEKWWLRKTDDDVLGNRIWWLDNR